MNLKSIASAACLVLGSAAFAGSAAAGTTVYSDFGSYFAATTGVSYYGFDGFAPDDNRISSSDFEVGPAIFGARSDTLFVIGANAGYGYYGTPTLVPFLSAQDGNPIEVDLYVSFTAMSFNLGSYVQPGPVTITLSNGDSFFAALPAVANTTQFIGFTSTSPFALVTISQGPNVLDVTNFTTAYAVAASAVPEPTTWGLMILGFADVGAVLRGRRTALAA